MGIGKVVRTISEKNTSVQDDIEVSQKGIIVFVPTTTTRVIGIPTTIEDPRLLTIMPMNQAAADTFGMNQSASAAPWYCDLTLHNATGVSVAFGSIASNILAAEIGNRIRISGDTDGYNLYIAAASMTSNYGASKHARLASTAYWRQDPRFVSNAKKYLAVTIGNSGSDECDGKKNKIAYEVRGYNVP